MEEFLTDFGKNASIIPVDFDTSYAGKRCLPSCEYQVPHVSHVFIEKVERSSGWRAVTAATTFRQTPFDFHDKSHPVVFSTLTVLPPQLIFYRIK